MQVDLAPELDRLVEEKVASGQYESPSEVVREALLDWMRQKTRHGFEQLDGGE